MRQKCLTILIFYFFAIALCFSAHDSFGLMPLSQSKTIDLGKIPLGREMKGILRVKNTSRDWLEITRVATSCGCTATEIQKNVIAPEEETEIVLQLKGKMRVETVSSDVIVEWKMPNGDKRSFQIGVSGQFVAPFLLHPDVVSVELDGSMAKGETDVGISITNADAQVKSINVELNKANEHIAAQTELVSSDESRLSLRISPEKMFAGSNRFTARIIGYDSAGTYVGENPLPIVVHVRADVEATPRQILINSRSAQDATNATVQLASRSGSDFKVETVDSDSSWLSGELQANSPDKPKTIAIKVCGPGESGKGNLFVKSSTGKKITTLCIPVFRSLPPEPNLK